MSESPEALLARNTLVHRLAYWAATKPNRPALHGKRDGRWRSLTWSAYWRNARNLAKGLIALGHRQGESVVVVGANHPEWVQIEFGIMTAAGVPAPIYPTCTLEQMAYIAKDSGARIVACDSEVMVDKFLEAEKKGLLSGESVESYRDATSGPALEHIVTFTEIEHEDPRVISFDALVKLGGEQEDSKVDARLDALTDENVCLMIYTSGTTGVPKGVEIDHGGQLLVGHGSEKFTPQFFDGSKEYHAISYLPLSHQAEQLLTNVFTSMVGGQVYFCPELPQVKDYLAEVRPTVFLGVPRVWEKFEAALRGRLGQATGIKAKLADWAMKTELECFREQVRRGVGADDYMPIARKIARSLVIDKVKQALGLDRLEIALTGSAPIAASTQEFFASLGICIYEVYGLTETSGAATITDPLKPAFGTVGKPFDGVTIRIGDEDEIQLKGRNMTKRYRGLPEETEALFTEDGWLKTGDAGQLDGEGNLKITGRLKELLITAGGKNVAPVELEFYIQSIVGVGQCVVVGDRKPFLSALITLDPEALDALAKASGSSASDMASLANDERVRAYLERKIDEKCNNRVARYQTIKKFSVLAEEMSVEGGELTASLKLRRPQIVEKHAAVIDAFYAGGTKSTPEVRA